MKKLKIALIAPPQESIPPKKYGGIELVVYNLTEELVKRGHKVFLLASADSKTSAELISVYEKTIIQSDRPEDRTELERLKMLGINTIVEKLVGLELDIIHHHWSCRLAPFFPKLPAPVVTTLHYNVGSPDMHQTYSHFKDANYISISDNQREGFNDLHYIGTVHHGIDINKYDYSNKKGEYFAFLGRIWPDKGPKEAILAAKAAGVKLKIAARVDFGRAEEYFKKEIEPLIDGSQIEFIGEVGPKEKSDFLKNAIGLISPIQWEEPFGLIFIEAMACGTPVISFARGAVPEIVKDGQTGFISPKGDISDMIEKIKLLSEMPEEEYKKMRYNARKHVEDNFTVEKMADEYEKIYYRMLKK
ncbi:MAG: glycosyltransferase family 4 protein [bacterium]|nr:glycosyltransferase family 4 protein [bacterium]